MEVALSARMCCACHEIFSCPFVFLVVKKIVTQLYWRITRQGQKTIDFVSFRAFRG